jgi:hypothetical protein
VLDVPTGRVVRTLPAGTPSPDWRRLYVVSASMLNVIDPSTGGVSAAHPVPDWAQVVRTSADGRWLVFSRAGPGDVFEVQDADWAIPPVDVALAGSFTFDGISDDGQRLYLLERLTGDHYHVRLYDLAGRALAPFVIVDKTNVSEDMSGTALAGFATRSGSMQLTLYQRSPGEGPAFVHALPIGESIPLAFCVDLPGPSSGWAFAPGPDGSRFYAVNPGAGMVVQLDQGSSIGPPGLRQGQIAAGAAGVPALAVSPDGATVYAGTGSGVLAVDAMTLAVRARGMAGRPVTALAATRTAVFAMSGTRLVRLDPRTLNAL